MVSIYDINDYFDPKLEKAINSILEDTNYNFKGKNVLIKPNMLAAVPPEKGTTTHPEIVRLLVNWLKKAGAIVTVSDSPGGSLRHNAAEKSAITTQIKSASQGCFRPMVSNIVEIKGKSKFTDSFFVCDFVLDADYVINVPKFKTHTLTLMTGSIKNMFGIITGNYKMKLHSAAPSAIQFSTLLVDIYQLKVPNLNIVDAIIGMEGNGPSHGKLRKIGKILASSNAIEIDSIIARMMGITPKSVSMLLVANSRGLGEIDLNKIKVCYNKYSSNIESGKSDDDLKSGIFTGSDVERIKDWKLPMNTTTMLHATFNPFAPFMNVLPVVNKKKCKKCKICVDSCPSKNIKFDKYPIIKRKNCIYCYCCSELCPEGAIKVPSIFDDLIRRIFS